MAQVSEPGPQGLELDLTPFRDVSEMETRLAVMNANGVDQAIVIPTHEYLRPAGAADTRQVNDAIAAYRNRDPMHFPAAVGIVELLHGRHAYDELQRVRDELGLAGFSFHTRFQGVTTDGYLVRGLIERMADLELVPFIHAYAGSPDEAPWMVAELAKTMPEVTMLVLDGFSGLERSAKESWRRPRRPTWCSTPAWRTASTLWSGSWPTSGWGAWCSGPTCTRRRRSPPARPVPTRPTPRRQRMHPDRVYAPNSSNAQDWRWVVVDDPEQRRLVGEHYRKLIEPPVSQMLASKLEMGDEAGARISSSILYLAAPGGGPGPGDPLLRRSDRRGPLPDADQRP